MLYIYSTLDVAMYAWVADAPKDLDITLFCDADFAGDRGDPRSQTGMFLTLAGPNFNFPPNAFRKKQGSTAKSTPEAEIVAVSDSLKICLIDQKCPLNSWRIMNRPYASLRVERTLLCLIWSGHKGSMFNGYMNVCH